MVEYRNVTSVKCIKNGGKWDCDIGRFLSDEPKRINDQVCFITKNETEKGFSDVHLMEDIDYCIIDDIGTARYLRCEPKKPSMIFNKQSQDLWDQMEKFEKERKFPE